MIKIRFLLLLIVLILGCANRGNPTGGEIDTQPPVVLKSSPENFTTNFNAEEIEIIFLKLSWLAFMMQKYKTHLTKECFF